MRFLGGDRLKCISLAWFCLNAQDPVKKATVDLPLHAHRPNKVANFEIASEVRPSEHRDACQSRTPVPAPLDFGCKGESCGLSSSSS